ncbi:MAG TPA: hypothetical protein VHN80_12755 [Kineosporiaceae bacterium]|nr:hypothetical protein [Kineosporiaceae bacterium]
MTARTRFVLWVALGQLAVALDLALQPAYGDGRSIRDIADDPGGPLRDFPALTRTQSLVWWDLTQHAGTCQVK